MVSVTTGGFSKSATKEGSAAIEDGASQRFDLRTSDRGVNQPNRHLQFPKEFAAKEITDGGKLQLIEDRAVARDPAAMWVGFGTNGFIEVRCGRLCFGLLRLKDADKRIVGVGEFLLIVGRGIHPPPRPHRLPHVRLAGAKPDFADEDILKFNGVAAGNRHLAGSRRGRQGIERDAPVTVRRGRGGFGLTRETDGHLFAGSWPSPTQVRAFAAGEPCDP